MSELWWFLAGAGCVLFPGFILYMQERETRKYFERDRDSWAERTRELQKTLRRRRKRP